MSKQKTSKKYALPKKRYKTFVKVSVIALCADVFLITLKYLLALLNNSTVLMADAFHSFGDLGITLTILITVIINNAYKDKKWIRDIEGTLSLTIALLLLSASLNIFLDVYNNTTEKLMLKRNVLLVIALAGISIASAVSFFMSRYKSKIGKEYNSLAFIAEGMHTASDFFTSIGVWFTLLLSYFGIHIERFTTCMVGILIFKLGFDLLIKGLNFYGISYKITGLQQFIKKIVRKLPGNSTIIRSSITFLQKIYYRIYTLYTKKIILPEKWILSHRKQIISGNCMLLFVLYVGTGFYQVSSYQKGIEITLGVVTDITAPGLHYHFPSPLGELIVLNTESETPLACGFRFTHRKISRQPRVVRWEDTHSNDRINKILNESILITGDENLVDINFLCYYRISDPVQFILKCHNSHEIMRSLFSYEIQKIVSRYTLEDIITNDRDNIQQTLKKQLTLSMQNLPLGAVITEVYMLDAHPPINVVGRYRAVASAREKKEEIIQKAHATANEKIPRSRGEAEALLLNAEGYKTEKIYDAAGEAESFRTRQKYFSRYKAVTKSRLWWENIEKALKERIIYILPSKMQRRFYKKTTPNSKEGV